MDRAERRKRCWKQAKRKARIDHAVYGEESFYDNLHQYSKNKIHCSCWMCRAGKECFKNSEARKSISEIRRTPIFE